MFTAKVLCGWTEKRQGTNGIPRESQFELSEIKKSENQGPRAAGRTTPLGFLYLLDMGSVLFGITQSTAHAEPTSLRHSLPSKPTAASDYFFYSPLPPAVLLEKISLETKLLGNGITDPLSFISGKPQETGEALKICEWQVSIFFPQMDIGNDGRILRRIWELIME